MSKKKITKIVDLELVDMWNSFIREIAATETDVVKSARGNVAAGVRIRKEFMKFRKMLVEMKKRTLDADRERVEKRMKENRLKKS